MVRLRIKGQRWRSRGKEECEKCLRGYSLHLCQLKHAFIQINKDKLYVLQRCILVRVKPLSHLCKWMWVSHLDVIWSLKKEFPISAVASRTLGCPLWPSIKQNHIQLDGWFVKQWILGLFSLHVIFLGISHMWLCLI